MGIIHKKRTLLKPRHFHEKIIFFLIMNFFLVVTSNNANGEGFSLPQLTQILISEHPRLKAMEKEVSMMKQRISVKGSLDDPKLKLGINSLPVDTWSFKDEGMTAKEIGISQMIPLGGKLGLQEEIARIEYRKSLERLRKERLELIELLKTNFYELTYVREAIKIVEALKEYVNLIIESEAASNKSGMGSLSNVVKASVELTMLDEELISLKQQEKAFLSKISYLVGRDVDVESLKLQPPEKDTPFSIEEIKEKITQNNPEIALLKLEEDLSTKERTLKEKEYIPDLELGVSYMQRDSTRDGMKRPDMVSAMAVVNIPLWFKKKNIPMIEEMQQKKHMFSSQIEDKFLELQSRSSTLLSQTKKWYSLYKLYQTQLIPQIELVFETTLSRYKTGNVELMAVIDTTRMLLRYKKDMVMAKKEYYATLAELSTLMGLE